MIKRTIINSGIEAEIRQDLGIEKTITNVPAQNVAEGKFYDGTLIDIPKQHPTIKIVTKADHPDQLTSPDGLFTITVECEDGVLREHLKNQLRYFLNDPQRAVNFLPKIKDAVARRNTTNTTIPKQL